MSHLSSKNYVRFVKIQGKHTLKFVFFLLSFRIKIHMMLLNKLYKCVCVCETTVLIHFNCN